jgi:spermidine/putrescine transport system ATP-binding protein
VPREEVTRRVERFLDLVGLGGLGGRFPSQLSGGQQQRVALARALVNQPRVLLLDEPLGALDLKLRKRMQIELKQLQREIGISFIYVTHDQDEALALSDQIAVMNGGAVLQYGSAREIYDRPRTEFVANFLGEANVLRGKVIERGTGIIVEVAGQRVEVPDAGEIVVEPGGPALVAVRPEHLVVGEGPLGVGNVLGCEIEDKVFLGDSFVIYLRTGDGCTLTVRGTDRLLLDALPRGGRVNVGWQPGASRLVAP